MVVRQIITVMVNTVRCVFGVTIMFNRLKNWYQCWKCGHLFTESEKIYFRDGRRFVYRANLRVCVRCLTCDLDFDVEDDPDES